MKNRKRRHTPAIQRDHAGLSTTATIAQHVAYHFPEIVQRTSIQVNAFGSVGAAELDPGAGSPGGFLVEKCLATDHPRELTAVLAQVARPLLVANGLATGNKREWACLDLDDGSDWVLF